MADPTPFDLRGRVAIVTGGAMGIGYGIARSFVTAGAQVLLADRDTEAGERAAASLGDSAAFVAADLGDPEAPKAVVQTCLERFGRLDTLVNNAGIYPMVELAEVTSVLFDEVIGLNLRGPLLMTQSAAEAMDERAGGSVINIASMDGVRPTYPGLAVYGASKGGVLTLTRHLALALAPRSIRVNAIIPGGITTEGSTRISESNDMTDDERDKMIATFAAQVPLGRLGLPTDIAGPAVFLASDAAAYITGATLVIDGGMMLR
jgi:2-dehydro-3-deoxy-D-gluconate 5-dehydrogenase